MNSKKSSEQIPKQQQPQAMRFWCYSDQSIALFSFLWHFFRLCIFCATISGDPLSTIEMLQRQCYGVFINPIQQKFMCALAGVYQFHPYYALFCCRCNLWRWLLLTIIYYNNNQIANRICLSLGLSVALTLTNIIC